VNLEALILVVLKISIALSVLAVGLEADVSDASFILRQPDEFGRAFFSMNVLMPLLAVALALTFNLDPAVKIALVVFSISPVAAFFPERALRAGGKRDYSVGLMLVTPVLAIIVIPVALEIFKRIFDLPLHTPARSIAALVFVTILVPLLVGIAVRAKASAFAKRMAKPLSKIAMLLVVLGVLPILFRSLRGIYSLIGNGTLLSFAGFVVAGYIIGYFLERPRPENRQILALANVARHPAIAAVVAHANFPQLKTVLPSVFLYVVVNSVITAIASKLGKARSSPKTESGKRMAP
jgi:bile acid:Na+ symporter, BASS family